MQDIDDGDKYAMLNQISELLPTLQQDPSHVTALVETLVRPQKITYDQLCAIQPAIDFAAGLASPSLPVNSVILSLLWKATLSRVHSETVAGQPKVVAALIRLWLCTPDTAVADQAQKVLLGLLKAHDVPLGNGNVQQQGNSFYEGLMWRRVFRDRDIYGSIFSICSLTTAGEEGQPSKREKTVAQGRLLDLILQIDCEALRTSQFPDIEEQCGVKNGGLLNFAACHMVDYKDDVLIHMTLINFFSKFLSSTFHSKSIVDHSPNSSKALDFLLENKLHSRTVSNYREKDVSLDYEWLYDSSADYIATYCSKYPTHLLSNFPSTDNSFHHQVWNALHEVSTNQWAQNQAPIHDLRILTSSPRIFLVRTLSRDASLFDIPASPPNTYAFGALATIFHGSTNNTEVSDKYRADEASSARALYFRYADKHPQLWTHVVKAAETVALKDTALAALDLLGAVITAQWAPLPTKEENEPLTRYDTLPLEIELSRMCHTVYPLPPSGILTILAQPALETVVPYLLRPAQSFSNLVGGRGDTESAAYQVAVRKYEVLGMFYRELQKVADSTGQMEEIVEAASKRLARGPMGGASDVGSSVGTMEL